MKHPINRKVQLYYVYNNIEFKRVLVPLRKLKNLSSWARSVMNLLMRYTLALKQTKKDLCLYARLSRPTWIEIFKN